MLTKSHSKLIQSLKFKKNRKAHKLFVVEGVKSVKEVFKNNVIVKKLFCLKEVDIDFKGDFEKIIISELELKKISNLKAPNKVLALCEIIEDKVSNVEGELILALDGVNDPGNLGTIIRMADWFGITTIICSENTVDVYNEKVIQSTMGSFSRVRIRYTNLEEYIKEYKDVVFGTFLEGENIYKAELPSSGMIVMGNEANGISSEIEKQITQKITIPQIGAQHTESLNVAMAASIILSEFRRKTF